jgi:transcriptional regulator with XRE-family HTH domain
MTRDLEQRQVARLERGDVNPTFETLLRLAGGLGSSSRST